MPLTDDDFRSVDNWMNGWSDPPAGWDALYGDADPLVGTAAALVAAPLAATAADRAARKDNFNSSIASLAEKIRQLRDLGGRLDFLINPPPFSQLDEERRTKGNVFGYIAAAGFNITDAELIKTLWDSMPFQMAALFNFFKALGLDPVVAFGQLRTLLRAQAIVQNSQPARAFPIPPPPPPAARLPLPNLADPNVIRRINDALGLAGIIAQAMGLGQGLTIQTVLQAILSINSVDTSGLGTGATISFVGGSLDPNDPANPRVGKWQMKLTPGAGESKPQTLTVHVNVPPDLLAAWKAQPIAYVQVHDDTAGIQLNVQGTVTWTDTGYTITFDNPASASPVFQQGHVYTLTFFFIG